MTTFDEIRSITQRSPSEATWEELGAALDEYAGRESLEHVVLPYCEAALTRWPDDVARDGQRWIFPIVCEYSDTAHLCVRLATHIGGVYHGDINKRGPWEFFTSQEVVRFLERADLSRIEHINLYYLGSSNDAHGLAPLKTEALAALAARAPASLSSLDLTFNELGVEGAELLASSPAFANLRFLDLSSCLKLDEAPAACAALAASPQLHRLETLRFQEDWVGGEGLEALASSRSITNLRELAFQDCLIDERGAHALATSPHFSQLRTLILFNDPYKGLLSKIGASIGDEGARALASSSHLTRLRKLDLSYQEIGSEGVGLLAQSENVRELEELDLSCNRIGPSGALAIASSPHLGALKRLNLTHARYDSEESNRLDDEGVAALLASPYLPSLTSVSLRGVGCGAESVRRALLAPGGPERLRELNLSKNALGNEGAAALARAPLLASLTSLNLSANEIGDRGVVALASSSHLSSLTHLNLSHNPFGDEGARALAASPHLTSLQRLSLDSFLDSFKGNMTEAGVRALAESEYLCEAIRAFWRQRAAATGQ